MTHRLSQRKNKSDGDLCKKALERLDERQRASAKVQEAYLATCWYKGRVRLSWVIYAQAPARVPPGYRGKPPVRTQGLQLDAHTGEVYLEVK